MEIIRGAYSDTHIFTTSNNKTALDPYAAAQLQMLCCLAQIPVTGKLQAAVVKIVGLQHDLPIDRDIRPAGAAVFTVI